ncbi:MAG TPA: hypothetical protein VK866_09510 [Acidimicrobiales bacterium]|nr:hypothetical protein [Acidimicrobiales bacterium]
MATATVDQHETHAADAAALGELDDGLHGRLVVIGFVIGSVLMVAIAFLATTLAHPDGTAAEHLPIALWVGFVCGGFFGGVIGTAVSLTRSGVH